MQTVECQCAHKWGKQEILASEKHEIAFVYHFPPIKIVTNRKNNRVHVRN